MRKLDSRFAGIAFAIGALAGCQTLQPIETATDVHTAMVDRIDPAAVAVWSIDSRTMSEASGSRSTRMGERSWNELEATARQLAVQADLLASTSTLRVGAHNDELKGFASGVEIQARIDADPAEFRRLAGEMALHAGSLAAAANRRDILQSQALTRSLYDNCRACHARYWETREP